ncbi:MAG TPA: hypothetical protein VLC07_10065, partial [Solirubrobacterales bacterium]|nr:hypothetical protein [Solirubrobacterales bacterium]
IGTSSAAVFGRRWRITDFPNENPIAETGNLLLVEQLLHAARAGIASGWTAFGETGFYCTIARQIAGIVYWQSKTRPPGPPEAPEEPQEEGWVLLHVNDPDEGFLPGQDPMLGVEEKWDHSTATNAATWRILWRHLHGPQPRTRDAGGR